MTGVAIALVIIGFIRAIVGNYNMWCGAHSMIGIWAAKGIFGILLAVAGLYQIKQLKT